MFVFKFNSVHSKMNCIRNYYNRLF